MSTNRPGIENLCVYLDEQCDFFKAPASTIFHTNYEGGLAHHSWLVYQLLKEKIEHYGLDIESNTIAIAGLCHDLCKIDFYIRARKWKKENGKWVEYETWEVDDKFPAGHGEKSVFVLNKFIQLTDEEILAIRWHLSFFDPGAHFNYPSGFPLRKAMREQSLVTLLFTADLESSSLVEYNDKLLKKYTSKS